MSTRLAASAGFCLGLGVGLAIAAFNIGSLVNYGLKWSEERDRRHREKFYIDWRNVSA